MQLHLFGAATPTGEAFRQLAAAAPPDWSLHAYSRNAMAGSLNGSADASSGVHPADFTNPNAFQPAGDAGAQSLWISFGPIWLLAPFLEFLVHHHPERLAGLCGLIACSSSSSITKRFAANRFDRELVSRLIGAEDQLLASCRDLGIRCQILRPSLIYGQVGPYGDRNLSRLITLMRRLPLLPLPEPTGLRQPIHANQLAAVAIHLARQLASSSVASALGDRIALGGDSTLSYLAMLQALQQALPASDPARRCRLLPIPSHLFCLLAFPMLLRSPKAFEALLRMGADLAGFAPSHQLLGQPPQPFPLVPLAGVPT